MAEAAKRAAAEKEAEQAAREERTIASDGRLHLRLVGKRHLILEDERCPHERRTLSSPNDTLFVEPEVGPIEPHLQPNGHAYSREVLAGSIDAAADQVRILYRITVWESRYVPGHWEYSHKFDERYEWSASTGAFSGSHLEGETPSV